MTRRIRGAQQQPRVGIIPNSFCRIGGDALDSIDTTLNLPLAGLIRDCVLPV